MAEAHLFYSIVVLFIIISPSHCSFKHKSCNPLHITLPTPVTASDYAFERDSNLLLTRLLGLPSNETRYFILPLIACHVMRLLQRMTLLPSVNNVHSKKNHYGSLLPFCRALIILLLILSGNIHVHPGPVVTINPMPVNDPCSNVNSCSKDLSFTDFCSRKALGLPHLAFNDFCDRTCLGFLHINIRSLLPKLDLLKSWVHTVTPDVLAISESWLKKSIANPDIFIPGYNVFRQDRATKGGGVALYVKDHLQCTVALSKSVPKLLELLVLKIKLCNNFSLSVAVCYRPPTLFFNYSQ